MNVVVVGYPKSGTTWLSRLTAELLACPVQGFLGREKREELAVEGRSRDSLDRVFKAHHDIESLMISLPEGETKIIYIVRDPRDVVISAANYFDLYTPRFTLLHNTLTSA